MGLDPASSIIRKLGGATRTAKVAGVTRATVNKWTWPRERTGTNGFIPVKYHDALISYAKDNNIPLAQTEFLPAKGAH